MVCYLWILLTYYYLYREVYYVDEGIFLCIHNNNSYSKRENDKIHLKPMSRTINFSLSGDRN